MSQYDFGIIDPYVTVGVELADMLNNWRDAMYSLQRGNTRPTFVVPGQLWINDAAGPTNWQLMWYVSPTVGDVPLFSLNTVTGAVTISASAGGTFSAAILLAQAAANPSVQWNATGNGIDAKNWRMTVNGTGALVLSCYSDAGVLQNSITFNRDGTITKSPSPGLVTATGGTHTNFSGPNTITFGSITYGNVGGWLTLANGQYKPPAGKYWIQCSNGVQAPTGGNGTWTLIPYKNAAAIPGHGVSSSGSASFSIGLTYGLYVDANGTDVFTFVASIGTGSGLMLAQGASFSAHPVG
jgi:hypothetical protein